MADFNLDIEYYAEIIRNLKVLIDQITEFTRWIIKFIFLIKLDIPVVLKIKYLFNLIILFTLHFRSIIKLTGNKVEINLHYFLLHSLFFSLLTASLIKIGFFKYFFLFWFEKFDL